MLLFLRMETPGRAAGCLRHGGHLFYIIILISFSIKSQHSVLWGLFVCPLQAWNKFVSISFPDEQFTQMWRTTLLADLKKRIQQVGLGEVDIK